MPTRRGWVAAFMTMLALASAGASGNNLLYLLFGSLAALLLLSAAGGWLTLRLLETEVESCGPAERGVEFPLRLRLVNRAPWPCWGYRLAWGPESAAAPWAAAKGSARASVRLRLPVRGWAFPEGLRLTGTFPFGLWSFAKKVRLEPVLVWPARRPARDLGELGAQVQGAGRPLPRKGAGEEFYAARELSPGDDARAIHWKLSAKAGRLIVADYGSSRDPRAVVRLPEGAEGDERLIEDAAAACRLIIDRGDEAALEAGGKRLGFGRGQAHLARMLDLLAGLGDGGRIRPVPAPAGRPSAPGPELDALRSLSLAAVAATFFAVWLIDEPAARWAGLGLPVLLLGARAQRLGRSPLPKPAWTLLSLLVLAWTALWDWRVAGVAIANVHLILYLLCYRALSPIEAREAGQALLIAFLGFFLASGLTISLWYFAAYLAFGAAALAWLSVHAGLPRRRWKASAPAGAAFSAAAAALAATLFVLTPRVEGFKRMNPLIAAGIDQLRVKRSAVMGFTEDVSLGWFGQLKRSSARVMRVKPIGWGAGRPGPLHVRGSAFDLFDGHRWTRASQRRAWAAVKDGRLRLPAPPPRVAAPPVEFTIYPMNLSILFTVETPWLLEGPNQPASYDDDDTIRSASPYLGGLRYRAYASPLAKGFGSRAPGYARLARERFLQLPPDPDGRLAALARLAVGRARTPGQKIRAVERFLRSRYSYSTYSDGRDRSLSDFLFRSRRGNCEYFATAGAILLREAGVPTRLVTGFLADDWNEYGRFFDVRQSEAHAWVEAYVAGRGWLLCDPTPDQTLLLRSADAFGQRLERWFEAAQTQWYRNVIGYDHYAQSDTFRRLGWLLSPQKVAAVLLALCEAVGAGLLLLAGAAGLGRLKRRWTAARSGLFARAQAALEREGLSRQPQLTPREYARDVSRRRPDLSAIEALAELHYLQRYSPGGLSQGEREREESLYQELRRAL